MNDSILSALEAISPSCDYGTWVAVGMGLKHEGYPVSVWDEWSSKGQGYPGSRKIESKWNSFSGSADPVTGATIVKIAQDEYGFDTYRDGVLDWDSVICDGENPYKPKKEWEPVKDLIRYLEVLFKPDDIVGYVTNDAYFDNTDSKWKPKRGHYNMTAAQIIEKLKKYDDDPIGYTFGDPQPGAGAWIRFNPLDGEGAANTNVTAYRYALVECDSIPISEQEARYRQLELPIACMVNSGGKSLHAIVHIDAKDYKEYSERVTTLYEFLENNNVPVDRVNRNPARLSRMPGVMRGDNPQYLVGTHIGRRSWDDWMDYVEGLEHELPDIELITDLMVNPPELAPELISGVLRTGHKLIISGASKAGKSFLLIELALAITNGRKWLGFNCRKGKVLYLNLEIDRASFINRVRKISEQNGMKVTDYLHIWNLRGHAAPLDKLVPAILRKTDGMEYDAVIIDPLYKVLTGDENNASEMSILCNQFDRIAEGAGAAVIYCHHHSKGRQGAKKAIDRASGSGVFARDPDAQLDLIELDLKNTFAEELAEGRTAFRLESSLREFKNIEPLNLWFDYPLHVVDEEGILGDANEEGSEGANLQHSSKRGKGQSRQERFNEAFEKHKDAKGGVHINVIKEELGLTKQTVYRYVKDEFSEDYVIEGGYIYRRPEGYTG